MCDFGLFTVPAAAAAAGSGAAIGAGLGAIGPLTAAATTGWLGTAATVLGAIGTVAQGVGQFQQSRYQAAVAGNNAKIAEMQAQDALKRGDIAEDQQRKKTGLILGTQRAVLGGQGTALDSGSPLDIQMDTAQTGELDALTIRSNAAREAWGYRAQAANYRAQADQAGGINSYLGAGASLLGGASTVADRWLRFRNAGLLPGA